MILSFTKSWEKKDTGILVMVSFFFPEIAESITFSASIDVASRGGGINAEKVKEVTNGKQTPMTIKPQTVPDFAIAVK